MSTPFVFEEAYCYDVAENKVSLIQKYTYSGPKFAQGKYMIQHVDVPS
jgi:hypothetical protein